MVLTTEYIKNVCKIGKGHDCCRYLLCGAVGFECGKLGALKGVIDSSVQYMSAQADNCEGVSNHDD
jgi:hypothetical protein